MTFMQLANRKTIKIYNDIIAKELDPINDMHSYSKIFSGKSIILSVWQIKD
jgi:hypothetical protein